MSNNNTNSKELNLSAPWFTHCRKLEVLFKDDPNVTVEFDQEKFEIRLLVNGQEKADALDKILVHEIPVGTAKPLSIVVVPANRDLGPEDTFRKAFEGNPVLSYVVKVPTLFPSSNDYVYCVFRNQVAQYWNDDLNDPHGLTSTLHEQIARDVFTDQFGVMFSTDTPDNLGVLRGKRSE